VRGRSPAVVARVGGECRRRPARADKPQTQSRQIDTGRPDTKSALLNAELALWRAFVGDEIDVILRDKD
jgi:hypothetical protein